MFINFLDQENNRLNRGVRRRICERVKELLDKKLMKGNDVYYIYENTLKMKEENEEAILRYNSILEKKKNNPKPKEIKKE